MTTASGPTNTAGQTANRKTIEVFRRASLLVDGTARALNAAALSRLGQQATGDIMDEPGERNETLRTHLRFDDDATALEDALRERQAAGTEGIVRTGETVEAATTRWARTVHADLQQLRTGASNFQTGRAGYRDPRHGFFNLHRHLVIALRDHGNLAWGATDFGGESGDIMHFDHRRKGAGSVIEQARRRR